MQPHDKMEVSTSLALKNDPLTRRTEDISIPLLSTTQDKNNALVLTNALIKLLSVLFQMQSVRVLRDGAVILLIRSCLVSLGDDLPLAPNAPGATELHFIKHAGFSEPTEAPSGFCQTPKDLICGKTNR